MKEFALDNIQQNVGLATYTTFKIGGPAEFFAEVTKIDQLLKLVSWAKENDLSVTVFGGGSNVLVDDVGIPGLVLCMKSRGMEIVREDEDYVSVKVSAGEVWDNFVDICVDRGWWGLENLSGIPGSVGATPIQNVGAYGVEVSELIEEVEVLHLPTLFIKKFSNTECCFGYRDSFFKREVIKEHIVTSVTYRLSKKVKPIIDYKDLQNYFAGKKDLSLIDIREGVLAIRQGKFPDLRVVGTAGSFFKNPVVTLGQFTNLQDIFPSLSGHETQKGIKISAAWLIDKVAGFRGVSRGGVGTHETQALVMVNHGGATAREVLDFSTEIIDEVYKKTKITLQPEVQFYPQSFGKS